MKSILATALKIFLVLLLLLLAAAAAYYMVHSQGWPWWLAAAILGGVFGLVLMVLFLKRWYVRRRERQFVKRVIDQDRERIDAERAQSARSAVELQERWREAIRVLRESSLSRFGNPLYALPWYLMLGAPGSGKTTAIRSARLHSPITDVTPVDGVQATRNCDWWFLDDAVIMDTAGRYATSLEQSLDREEWREFLILLAKYRKKEPISGLVVTLDTDSLLQDDADGLVRSARSIRRRVDELMRTLGASFPIYILVTKLDRLMGMKSFCSLLNKGDLHQAMGWMNTSSAPPDEAGEQAVDTVTDRLKDLRLWLASKNPDVDPALVLFPEELLVLKPGLRRFTAALFERNPFQETPLLRGIYFSSGRQEGDTLPHLPEVLKDFKLQAPKRPDTHKGLFLHDFFSTILPGDRRLYSPLFEFVRWRRLTHNLGMVAAMAIILGFIGLITFSYSKNHQALNEFIEDFETVPAMSNDLRRDLILMDRFREELFRMQVLNKDWILPRMGMHQSLLAQERLENVFCDLFRKGLMARLDTALRTNIAALDPNSPEQELTRYIAHLVGRINLLDAELQGATPGQLLQRPMPDERVFSLVDDQIIPEVAEYFDRLYVSYLDLNTNPEDLIYERGHMMGLLRDVLKSRRTELNWLVDWANDLPDISDVTMQDFWGLTAQSPEQSAKVPAAYTVEGRERILDFLKQVESALQNENLIDERVQTFKVWYDQQYADAWRTFAAQFPDGENWERSYLDWKTLAASMSSDNNPYFKLLKAMARQLRPIADTPGAPVWVQTVLDIDSVASMQDQQSTAKTRQSLLGDIQSGKEMLQSLADQAKDINATAEQPTPTHLSHDTLLKAVDPLHKYEDALQAILPATMNSNKALSMAQGVYKSSPDSGQGQSPFENANTSLVQVQHLLSVKPAEDYFIWDLLGGPLRFLLDFTIIEAAREIQNQWEAIVLAAVSDAPESKQSSLLFDKQTGAAWKFADGPAKPFLGRNQAGYFANSIYGKRFPFDATLFRFLEQGGAEVQILEPQYQVAINARPTDVNDGAIQDPYATVLTLDCAKGSQTLENFNYPQAQTFTWTPDDCGDTLFSIKFENFTLSRRYAGNMGFAKFLSDFRFGSRIFSVEDFPDQAANLELLGIKEIIVNYAIDGGNPVIQLLNRRHVDVPKVVVEPWVF